MRVQAWPVVLALVAAGCVVGVSGRGDQSEVPPFGDRETMGVVAHDAITEASGLVASRQNPDVLWTHNDSGDGPHLYALNVLGEHLGVYTLDGVQHRDWEDLTLGPGPEPGVDYLYVGDIGDNALAFSEVYIYRVREPALSSTQDPVEDTLTGIEKLTFTYPDAQRDAETLMSDPLTGDLYVVSKGASTVQVYRAPFPQSAEEARVFDKLSPISLGRILGFPKALQGAVGGDIKASGTSALVKTYKQVFFWNREDQGDPFLKGEPAVLPYEAEPQGEALAWAADGSGYFTLSEERDGKAARLYFYPNEQRTASTSAGPVGVAVSAPVLDSLHTALHVTLQATTPNQVRVLLMDGLDRPAHVWEGRMDGTTPADVVVDARGLKTGMYTLRVETPSGWSQHPVQIDHP